VLYDISPPLTPDIAVFPGDTPLSREVLLRLEDGDPVTLSTLHTTVHVGAHIDGPNHYAAGAPGVDAWLLERCIGPCRVAAIEVERGALIESADLAAVELDQERLLLHTGTFPNPTNFNADFAALHPDAVDLLHDAGVMLVGIDTPSVDPGDSTTLDAHQRFRANGMMILEGICLEDVPPGCYELIAAPLKLVGFDGSPVRAVLRTLP